MVPSRISIQSLTVTEQNYEILRQRTARNYACTRRMETLPDGSGSGFRDLDRSSESPVLLKTQKLNHHQARWVTELAEYHFLSPPQTGSVEQESRFTQSQSRSRTGEGGQR